MDVPGVDDEVPPVVRGRLLAAVVAPPFAAVAEVDDPAAAGEGASLRVDMSWIRTPGPTGESSSTIPGIV